MVRLRLYVRRRYHGKGRSGEHSSDEHKRSSDGHDREQGVALEINTMLLLYSP